MLKNILKIIIISCISFSTFAESKKMIFKGDYEAGGNMSLSSTSNAVNSTYFSLYSKLQYFVIDNLSIGGSISYSHSSASSLDRYGVGPSASYYFWTKEKMAAYFSQALYIEKYDDDSYKNTNKSGTSTLGINYFLTPSVALGLTLNYYYNFETFNDYTTRSLRLAFVKYF